MIERIKIKNKKGFTLVELLSVIVILAVILVIAVPTIMDTINNVRKGTLESTAKLIASSAEKRLIENQTLGINKKIKCSDLVDLDSETYGLCKIEFDEDGNASVILNGKEDGKFDNMACSGTKDGITCNEGQILPGLNCIYEGELIEGAEFIHNQYTYRYKQDYNINTETGMIGWMSLEDDGWGVILTDKSSTEPVNTPVCSYINGKPLLSTSLMFFEGFNEEAESQEEYVISSKATSIDVSDWDTDNVVNMMGMFAYTDAATITGLQHLETSNVTNMISMFQGSAATSLDLSKFETLKVTNMSSMFSDCTATTVDVSSFDTTNVIDMSYMFNESSALVLNLSRFDTRNVTDMNYMFAGCDALIIDLSSFNVSNVTNMESMFYASSAEILDLSSFDISNVTNINGMFSSASATTGYARNEEDAAKFNNSSVTNIPLALTFVTK